MMSAYINVCNKKTKKQIYGMLQNMGLENTFSNYRTSIWENEDVHISVDRKITRILLYDEEKDDFAKKMLNNLC